MRQFKLIKEYPFSEKIGFICTNPVANLNEYPEYWVEIFEPKFKNGDVVETYSGAIFLITDVENNRGYGFSSNGIWFSENNLNIKWKKKYYVPQFGTKKLS